MSPELTTIDFWDSYWSTLTLPRTIDPTFSFDRCLSEALTGFLAGRSGDSLEIGCAPGAWMVFMAGRGFCPSGIEYSRTGLAATEKNLSLLGVSFGELIAADFLALPPEPRFDVVMSLGFIEHFEEPMPVIERHVGWLKSGGLLVLGVPNFRGLHGAVQRFVGPEVLAKHNRALMTPAFFEDLQGPLGLTLHDIRYLGGFEPALPMFDADVGRLRRLFGRVLIAVASRLRRIRAFDDMNGPRISSYLLATFEKAR
jgi:SAM-dependent methyltransferase